MTEDNTTDTGDDQGQNEDDKSEDSAVIQALRKELKEAQRSLKAQPSRSEIEEQIRASVAREGAIERELVSLKVPASVRQLVEEKLGDAEVTAEAVTEALTGLGFEVTDPTQGGTEDDGTAAAVDAVASLGNQVQAAAQHVQGQDVDAKLAAAETPEQIDAIMREAGLAV